MAHDAQREPDDAETDYQFFWAGRAFWNCKTQASLFHDLRRWRGHKDLRTTEPSLAGSESHAPHVRAAVEAAFSF